MANAQLLEKYFSESGKKKTHLSKALGVSRPYLNRLLRNPELSTVFQAEIFCKELNIKKKADRDDIFLP